MVLMWHLCPPRQIECLALDAIFQELSKDARRGDPFDIVQASVLQRENSAKSPIQEIVSAGGGETDERNTARNI